MITSASAWASRIARSRSRPRAARHLDVGDHQVVVVRVERDEGAVDVAGGGDVVALLAQEDLEELAHAALVVDDQDARVAAHRGRLRAGQQHAEPGSAPDGAFDAHVASVSFHDAVDGRQTETRSLLLRGEEGIEDAFEDVVGDPDAAVDDLGSRPSAAPSGRRFGAPGAALEPAPAQRGSRARPPSGIACTALRNRFQSAWRSWRSSTTHAQVRRAPPRSSSTRGGPHGLEDLRHVVEHVRDRDRPRAWPARDGRSAGSR